MPAKDTVQYRWIILSIFIGSQLVLSIAGYGWGPLAPFLKKTMSLSGAQIGAIASCFYFAAAAAAFPAGVIVDRYGVKIGLLGWLALTGIPLLFLTVIHNLFSVFLLLVAVSGIGYGMGNPVSSKGLYLWFDQKTRGTVFGLKQAGVTVGAASAGILLVYISRKASPFTALQTVGVMIMIMFAIAFFFYHDPARPDKDADIHNHNDKKNKPAPGVNFRILFSNRALMTLAVIITMLGFIQGVVVVFITLYLNESMAFPVSAAGLFFTILMISGAFGRVFWGVMSDRIFNGNRKIVLIIMSAVAVLSVIILAVWVNTWPHWLFACVIFLIGISTVGWNSVALVFVTEICSTSETATAIGLVSTTGWAGLSSGPLIFGSLTDHYGYLFSWFALAMFCAFTFVLCFFLPAKAKNR